MSESRTACPFCDRQPGDSHARFCPRHGSPRTKREARGISSYYRGQWRKPTRLIAFGPMLRHMFGRRKV